MENSIPRADILVGTIPADVINKQIRDEKRSERLIFFVDSVKKPTINNSDDPVGIIAFEEKFKNRISIIGMNFHS